MNCVNKSIYRLVLFVIALSISSFSQGQEIDYTVEDVVKKDRFIILDGVEVVDDVPLYITSYRSMRGLKGLMYNVALDSFYDIGVPYKHSYSYETFTNSDRLFRWVMTADEESKSLIRYLVEYSPTGEGLGVLEVDRKENHKNRKHLPFHLQKYSLDSTYMATFQVFDRKDGKEPFIIKSLVLGNELSKVTDYTWKMGEKSQKKFDFMGGVVNKEGTAYALIKEKINLKKKTSYKLDGKKAANQSYKLLSFKGSDHAEYDIPYEKMFSKASKLYINSEGTVFAVFILNEKYKEDSRLIGFRICSLKAGETEVQCSNVMLSEDQFKKWGYKKGIPREKDFRDFLMRDQFVLTDRGIAVFSERDILDDKYRHLRTAIVLDIDDDAEDIDVMLLPKDVKHGIFDADNFHPNRSLLISMYGKPYLLYSDTDNNFKKEITDVRGIEDGYHTFSKNRTDIYLAHKNTSGEVIRERIDGTEGYDIWLAKTYFHSNYLVVPLIDFTLFGGNKLGELKIKLE